MTTILLLTVSNIFMTFAWYGHLKYTDVPLWKVIGISWGIAFAEHCLMVPANRIGYGQFSAAQLKTIQEIITLVIFVFFSVFYTKRKRDISLESFGRFFVHYCGGILHL